MANTYTLNGYDTKDWFLLTSITPTLSICCVYFIFVKFIGPKLMEKRKPFSLKTIISIYNIIQIVACIYLIYLFFLGGFHLKHMYHCDNNVTIHYPTIQLAIYYTFLMKFVELLETVFFVLRKKHDQISNLHVYHHISTFIIAYVYNSRLGGDAMSSFPMVINNLVHVVMYGYYFLSAIGGSKWQRKLLPFKKFITKFQLIQFIAIVANAILYANSSCYGPNSLSSVLAIIPDIIILFYMFSKFYIRSYLSNKQKI